MLQKLSALLRKNLNKTSNCLVLKYVPREKITNCHSFFYVNYIIHCKIKKYNHQVPKIVTVPGNKTNPKKIRLKIYKNMQVTTAINTEFTDS